MNFFMAIFITTVSVDAAMRPVKRATKVARFHTLKDISRIDKWTAISAGVFGGVLEHVAAGKVTHYFNQSMPSSFVPTIGWLFHCAATIVATRSLLHVGKRLVNEFLHNKNSIAADGVFMAMKRGRMTRARLDEFRHQFSNLFNGYDSPLKRKDVCPLYNELLLQRVKSLYFFHGLYYGSLVGPLLVIPFM
jgi:hypothetical protein